MKQPTVDCPYCKGTGKSEISLSFLTTWAVLSRAWVSTNSVADTLKLNTSATLQRLSRMRDAGLVEQRGNPRGYEWRRVGL